LYTSNFRKYILSFFIAFILLNLLVVLYTKNERIANSSKVDNIFPSTVVQPLKWKLIDGPYESLYLGDSACFSMVIPEKGKDLNLCTEGSSTPEDDLFRLSFFLEKKSFNVEKVIFLQTYSGWISGTSDSKQKRRVIQNTPFGNVPLRTQSVVLGFKDMILMNIPILSENEILKDKLSQDTIKYEDFEGNEIHQTISYENGHLVYSARDVNDSLRYKEITLIDVDTHLKYREPIASIFYWYEANSYGNTTAPNPTDEYCKVSNYDEQVLNYMIDLSNKYDFELFLGISPVVDKLSQFSIGDDKIYSNCVQSIHNSLLNFSDKATILNTHEFFFTSEEAYLVDHTTRFAAKRYTKFINELINRK